MMREDIWWKLHNSSFVRKIYANRVFAPVMRKASNLLLPPSTEKVLKVRSGLGEGLVFGLNPRWEPELWQGHSEPSSQKVAVKYFKPGKTLYDVGGGVGFYTLVASRLGAQVFTIEPDPKNRATIQRHAEMNNLEGKLQIMPIAANSYTGSMLMEPSDRGHGHGHGHAQEVFGTDPSKCFEVQCTTLDDFAGQNPHPDLVKIDVEGCEAAVVRGAEWLMREVGPSLLVEIHTPELAEEVSEIVHSRNYKIEWIDDEGYTVRWLYATAA
jgi:FkbM family methyltransferase